MLVIDVVDLDHHVERNINNLLPFVGKFKLIEQS